MIDPRDTELFSGASIAFDLDGTLVDTAPDLVRALNAVIEPEGLGAVPLDDVRAMVGRGARALIERAFARESQSIEDARAVALVERFIEIYKADVAAESRVFPGVEDTLVWLRERGAELSICTNKPSVLSDLLIAELGLADHFVRIIGPERTTAKKPDAAHVLSALGERSGPAALVGDSAPDVGAARAAGIPSIVLSYGYSEKPAGSLGADRVIHAFEDVPRALADLWRA